MRLRCFVCFSLTVTCLLSSASLSEDKQAGAAALITQAKKISDIRAAGSPAFRLIAKVRVFGADKHSIDGSYAEVWVAAGQWRRETIIGEERRIEVVSQQKRYSSDNARDSSDAANIIRAISFIDTLRIPISIAKIKDGETMGVKARCVLGSPETLCFDQASGRLLSRAFVTLDSGQPARWLCQYGEYQEFTNRMFPGASTCAENGQEKLQIRVSELSQQSSFDTKLFEPPAGSFESAFRACNSTTPPQVMRGPDPDTTHGFGAGITLTTLHVTIDQKGQVRNPRIVESVNPELHYESMNNLLEL